MIDSPSFTLIVVDDILLLTLGILASGPINSNIVEPLAPPLQLCIHLYLLLEGHSTLYQLLPFVLVLDLLPRLNSKCKGQYQQVLCLPPDH